jgi:uncharacterized membrane protein
MVESNLDSTKSNGRIVIYPNRSVSWRTVKLFLWFVSAFAMLIAGSFAVVGLWLVLPFAGLEILALVLLMYWVALQCRRQQVIRIGDHQIVVEKGYESPRQTWASELFLARLIIDQPPYRGHPQRLYLRGKRKQLEIGEFLNEEDKKKLVAELQGVVNIVKW